MSDPKYNKYAGTVRFDDENIVDIDLQPDTENIRVLLNGSEVAIGAELPTVTAADNGDVLTVVEGAWAKAAPAAGGSDFYVDFSVDPQDPTGMVANKTIAQITEAVTAGLRVVGRYQVYIDNVLDTVNYIPLTAIYLTEGNEYAVFQGLGALLEGQISIWNYGVDSSGVTYEELFINLATQ